MPSVSTNRPPAQAPAPAPSNWFTQNGLSPVYSPQTMTYATSTPNSYAQGGAVYQPGPNQTQPYGAAPLNPNLPPGLAQTARPQTTAPTGPPPSGGTPTPDELLAVVSQFPATYEGAQAANAEVQRRWGANAPQLLEHATKLDKWQFANGQVYDLMNSAGSPQASWVTHATPEMPHAAGGGAMGGGGSTMPGAYAGASPGYDFRMKEGLRALQNSAAARGTLLTGGTLKDITRFGQDYASGEFQNDFARNYSLANLGFNAANAAAQYGSAYGNQSGNLASNQGQAGADLITGGGNAAAAGTIGGANANRQWYGDVAGQVSQIPWYQLLSQTARG